MARAISMASAAKPFTFHGIVREQRTGTEQLTAELCCLGLDDPRRTQKPASSGRRVADKQPVVSDERQRGGTGENRAAVLPCHRVRPLQRRHHLAQIAEPVVRVG